MENSNQFLNPQSMITPGLCGGVAMAITNSLTVKFGLGEPWPGAVALIASFVLGLLVMASDVKPYWKRSLYYVVNSFIIFNVAVGSNTLGQAVGVPAPSPSALIPTALAQPPIGWCCLNNMVNSSHLEECNKWGGRFFSTQEQAQQACRAEESMKKESTPPETRFFRPWFKTPQ